MWHPTQKIVYRPEAGRCPSREDAEASRLFSPVRIGGLTLRSRTWVPAMVPWRASAEGEVTRNVLDWYGRFAQGQPGAIVIEATGIRDVPSGPLLRIGHDRYIDGLAGVVETIHRESEGKTRAFVQLIDFLSIRRRPEREKFFERFLVLRDRHRAALGLEGAPEAEVRRCLSELDEAALAEVLDARELEGLRYGARERVTDTHLPHVRALPQVLPDLFAAAARRARQAGFDGVELHYAHAYTMASFLSPTNTRDDGYGGPREQRVRLPLEVFRAVRAEVGPDYPVGCRFLAQECIAGGGGVEDAAWFAVRFAEAGMDFLSTSRGGKFDDAKQPRVNEAAYPYTGPSGYECMPTYLSDKVGPFGRNVVPTQRVRQAVREAGYVAPVVVTGGIHNFEQAEAILAGGAADIVGSGRQSLADPEWWKKVREGRADQVHLCEFKNYCEGLDQKHKQVTCQLWDRVDLAAPATSLASDGRRRLTAPAGW